MDKIDPKTANLFLVSYQKIRSGYEHCNKRARILLDYYKAIEEQLSSPKDVLDIMQKFGRILELHALSDTNQNLRNRFEPIRQYSLRVAELVGSEASAPQPTVAKFLRHATELNSDVERLLEEEIFLGREMANLSDKVSGTTKLRELLEAQFPLIKWADVEHFMRTALDSPLAAKLDDE